MGAAHELPAGLELVRIEHAAGAREAAIERARNGAEEGTLVWVLQPEAPRARGDAPWLTADAPGLHAALVLRPGLPADQCAQLGPAAVLALGRALAALVEPMTELHYRWPNDVLLDGGKVAGVWLDGGGTAERVEWLVISWAINVSAAPASLGFAAAALQPDGASGEVDAALLLQSIARELVSAIVTWDEAGFDPVRESWRARLQLADPLCLRMADGSTVAGTPETLHDDGALSVRTEDATRRVELAEFFGIPGSAGT